MAIFVRRVQNLAEYQAIQEVQRRTFGFGPHDTVMHLPMMVALQKNGGLVLGAFASEPGSAEDLIGFAIGFVGRNEASDQYFHYSQIVAALTEWQSRGVGLALKEAQRREAMAQGYNLIRWSFDPLLARNAYFNFAKLGGVCHEYVQDMYGPGRGEYFGSLDTDRLIIDWELTSPRVSERLAQAAHSTKPAQTTAPYLEAPNLIIIEWLAANVPAPVNLDLNRTEPRLKLEIPHQIGYVRQNYAPTAALWRTQTRELFNHYFAADYHIADFFTTPDGESTRAFYLLES